MHKHRTTEDDLHPKSRERLVTLESQFSLPWDQPYGLHRLSLPDLKLLLEHCTPLQELIRALVATPASSLGQDPAELSGQTSFTHTAQTQAETALASTQAELEQTHERCRAAQQDLSECTATAQKLAEENRSLQKTIQKLERQCLQLKQDLSATQQQLSRSSIAPAELTLLRQDTALAKALGLEALPADDTQALIQVVAVLSQRDNLERLWGTLKDRCEAEKCPATADEHALLQAALAWHNHNWRTRPYRLIEAAPASAYHFESHQRSRHSKTGETVVTQLLPGIADGSGQTLCKALIQTQ